MESQEDQSAKVVERLASLGAKDREAVLDRMSPDERLEIESTLRQHAEEKRIEEERQKRIDRQFLGYSPWLASLIEHSQETPPDSLTPASAKALWEVHGEKVSSGMTTTRSGWLGFTDRVNDWLAQFEKSSA